MRKGDIILILILIVLSVGGMTVFFSNKTKGTMATIHVNGEFLMELPLNTNTSVTIKTDETNVTSEENFNVITIEDGKAFVTQSDCPDKVCVEHKKISYINETISCLPHKLVVELTGNSEGTFDTVS